MTDSTAPATPSLLRPLRTPTFRNLLVADVVSDIGAFMQSVGAAWLMISLNAGPLNVALIQTTSSAFCYGYRLLSTVADQWPEMNE